MSLLYLSVFDFTSTIAAYGLVLETTKIYEFNFVP